MNYEKLTTVEVRVKRNRRIRFLLMLAFVVWVLLKIFDGEFVLAHNKTLSAAENYMAAQGEDQATVAS